MRIHDDVDELIEAIGKKYGKINDFLDCIIMEFEFAVVDDTRNMSDKEREELNLNRLIELIRYTSALTTELSILAAQNRYYLPLSA